MAQTIADFGKYQVGPELGQGGFATVFRATDLSLGRQVALKVLHPQLLSDSAFINRFMQEARTLAALRHPQIATIYEIGEHTGRLFIAMELADGPTLAAAIKQRGRIPWPEALTLLKPVCAALDYAYGQGFVHRDLKPSNLLIDRLRGPLLSDFGFARLIETSGRSMSLTGAMVGTPGYMAPELWDGQEATPASDLYALACVVFEMLTGEALFAGQTPLQVLKAHERGPRFPGSWAADVPPALSRVLARGLSRDPAQRHPSALALWHELAEAGAESAPIGPPATSGPVAPTLPERPAVAPAQAATPNRRRSAAIAIGAGALLLALLTMGWLVALRLRAETPYEPIFTSIDHSPISGPAPAAAPIGAAETAVQGPSPTSLAKPTVEPTVESAVESTAESTVEPGTAPSPDGQVAVSPIAGAWGGSLIFDGVTYDYTLVLSEDQGRLEGYTISFGPRDPELYGIATLEGSFDGVAARLAETRLIEFNPPDSSCLISFELSTTGQELTGTWRGDSRCPSSGPANFSRLVGQDTAPEAIVGAFYSFINVGAYDRAYALLSDAYQLARPTFPNFVAELRSRAPIEVIALSAHMASAPETVAYVAELRYSNGETVRLLHRLARGPANTWQIEAIDSAP